MTRPGPVHRRTFLNRSLAATATTSLLASSALGQEPTSAPSPVALPKGRIGNATMSRVLLGGNLISGYMHSRDLMYVNSLFRAYATEQKILDTLALAEANGIDTVFETGGDFVTKYNRERGGRMQFIPHIQITSGQTDAELADHIKTQVDTGGVALYVWGVAGDTLVRDGEVAKIARAVEMAKKSGLPVGVGGHSLQVPIQCEKIGVPCDFYVKTFHSDDYPSAWPKEQRKDFAWLDGAPGWYDNMWCINPEETIAFMETVTKPWIAFKILAAGAIPPLKAFPYAFENGADFTAVGMFDFQVESNCHTAERAIRRAKDRKRPWRA
jgi:hypothetical protein